MNEMTAEIARAKGAERLENVYFTVNLGTRFVVVGGINGKTHVVTCFKHGRVTKARPWKDACRSYGRGNEETVFTVVDDRLGSSRMKGRSMDDAFINHAIDEKLTGDYEKSKYGMGGWKMTYRANNETMYKKRAFYNSVVVKDFDKSPY